MNAVPCFITLYIVEVNPYSCFKFLFIAYVYKIYTARLLLFSFPYLCNYSLSNLASSMGSSQQAAGASGGGGGGGGGGDMFSNLL